MIRTRATLTTLSLLCSFFSFIAYTLLLKRLGASSEVDALFYAASVPISISGVATGVLLYLLPPRLIQLSASAQNATVLVLSSGVAVLCLVATVFAVIMWLLDNTRQFWILWIAFVLTASLLLINTLLTCVAEVRAIYLAAAIAPLITASGLLLGAIGAVAVRVEWLLVVGQLAGAILGAWWLQRTLAVTLTGGISQAVRQCRELLAPISSHALAIVFGTIGFTLFQPVDAALCAHLPASGCVSIMAYAQRVLVAVSTLVSLGAYAIAARRLKDAMIDGGKAALLREANAEVLRFVSFGLLVWGAYHLGASHLLEGLMKASSMSETNLQELLHVLGWMLLGSGPMAAMPYLFRVFYTVESYRQPAVLGVLTVILYAFSAGLMLEEYGILAMAYSYCVVWWLVLITALISLNHRF